MLNIPISFKKNKFFKLFIIIIVFFALGVITVYGTTTITDTSITTTGDLAVTGWTNGTDFNASGYYYGDGSQLTGITGTENASWNETYAGTLYSTIDEPFWASNYTAFNDSWASTYNATYDAKVSDNTSWNETHANTLYSTILEPLWAGNYSSFNISWTSTFNSTYDALVTENVSWNETYSGSLYSTILEPLWAGNYSAFNTSWSADTTIGNCSVDDSCTGIYYLTNSLNGSNITADSLSGIQIAELTDADISDTLTCSNMEGTDWGTLTDTKWCVYDLAGTEVDCNVNPVTDTTIGNCSVDDSCTGIYYLTNALDWANITCSDCLDGDDIDESSLVMETDWYNTSAEIIAAINTSSYYQVKSADLVCTNCIGGTEIAELADADISNTLTCSIMDLSEATFTNSMGWGNLTAFDLDVTWTNTLGGGNITADSLSGTQIAELADADISDTLTCSDLQAGSSVVEDSEVDDDITIDSSNWVNTTTGVNVTTIYTTYVCMNQDCTRNITDNTTNLIIYG
ncbi:MAG: hypothetical protein KKB31_02400 [Nanoarchaeota archaeon]|nr:hypothetical protein [Nanoarchaeota archaeon]